MRAINIRSIPGRWRLAFRGADDALAVGGCGEWGALDFRAKVLAIVPRGGETDVRRMGSVMTRFAMPRGV